MRSVCGLVAACIVLGAATRVRSDEKVDPQAVIDQAIKALGGEDKLKKYKSATWKGKGTIRLNDQLLDLTGEWFVQPPRQVKMQVSVDFMGMKYVRIQVLNGDKGWATGEEGTHEMSDVELAAARESAYSGWVSLVVPLKEPGFELVSLGEEKIGAHGAVGVKVSHKDHKDISLYFDKESGLPIKMRKRARDVSADQEFDEEYFYSDYSDFGGIQHYKKISIKRDGKEFLQLQATEYKPAEKLDDAVFSKPE